MERQELEKSSPAAFTQEQFRIIPHCDDVRRCMLWSFPPRFSFNVALSRITASNPPTRRGVAIRLDRGLARSEVRRRRARCGGRIRRGRGAALLRGAQWLGRRVTGLAPGGVDLLAQVCGHCVCGRHCGWSG